MLLVWFFFNIINVAAWICIYSLYLELNDLTRLQDLARLKVSFNFFDKLKLFYNNLADILHMLLHWNHFWFVLKLSRLNLCQFTPQVVGVPGLLVFCQTGGSRSSCKWSPTFQLGPAALLMVLGINPAELTRKHWLVKQKFSS